MTDRIKKYMVSTFFYFIVYAMLYAKKDGGAGASLAMAISAGVGNALGRENVINKRSLTGELLFLLVMLGIAVYAQFTVASGQEEFSVIDRIYLPFAMFTIISRFFETNRQALEKEENDESNKKEDSEDDEN